MPRDEGGIEDSITERGGRGRGEDPAAPKKDAIKSEEKREEIGGESGVATNAQFSLGSYFPQQIQWRGLSKEGGKKMREIRKKRDSVKKRISGNTDETKRRWKMLDVEPRKAQNKGRGQD